MFAFVSHRLTLITLAATNKCPSTEITIGALSGKSTHFALAWDAFDNKKLLDLFDHFYTHQLLPEKKTGPGRRTVTLAFKFDVSIHDMGLRNSADTKLGSDS